MKQLRKVNIPTYIDVICPPPLPPHTHMAPNKPNPFESSGHAEWEYFNIKGLGLELGLGCGVHDKPNRPVAQWETH